MKNLLKLLPVFALVVVNACSFANSSTVRVPINSNPPGASVTIDGKNYGQTPVFAELKPSKNYKATISKAGFTPATIDMETWYSLRDGDGADGKRCMADVGSFVLPYFIVLLFAPEKCGSFKQSDFFVDLSANAIPGYQDQNNQPSNQGQYNQYNPNYNQQNQYGGASPYQNSYYQNYQQ